MKTLIEIHAIQNFAPSNLNRDDTGAPKDALFGGTRRSRVSSQCLKRAVREYFLELVKKDSLSSDSLAIRTKRLLDALTKLLVEKGRDESESAEKSRLALAAMELTVKEDGKSQYLLFLGHQEVAGIANIINEKWDAIISAQPTESSDEKKAGKSKKKAAETADPELKKALDKAFNGGKSIEVALFGRMLADMPEKNQYAACQVAHAISTHAVDREFDFYTAVDQLKPEDNSGADMMGTVEFNSACFYRYAVIDWNKFVENLQNDVELAKKGVTAFLEGFVVSEPTGKQNTFAAHNPPEFVAISVHQNMAPINLANAFEVALYTKKGESITAQSAKVLMQKAKKLRSAYNGGVSSTTRVLNLTNLEQDDDFGVSVNSLEELLNQTRALLPEKV